MSARGGRGARRIGRTRTLVASVVSASIALTGAGCGADAVGPRQAATTDPSHDPAAPCSWPMTGFDLARTFRTTCASAIDATSVDRLEEEWFHNTDDVVTTTPTVVDGTVYVGDWSGTFYALDAESGARRWTYATEVHPQMYAGQITGGAAVAELNGEPTVVFGAGKTVYALRTATGELVWKHTLNPGRTDDDTEIESSVAIVGSTVIVGFDVHNNPNFRAGVVALDGARGNPVWTFDGDQGGPTTGCVDVWGSPSVDVGRKLVFFGTGNCTSSPAGWSRFTEALIAVELDTGKPVWTYQPHPPNNDDLDFAGYPNLFEIGGRPVVGLGNKDGTYYAVDRATGELVWKAKATEPGLSRPGSNFSTGGFIGGTAVADGVVVGGTAVGPPPYLHGIDAESGEILWQQTRAEATYGNAAIVNDVAFSGGNDFTLRAVALRSGDILWSHEMRGVVAGGVAIVGDHVYAVAGIREPGSSAVSTSSGVYRFRLGAPGTGTTTTAHTPTTGAAGVPVARLTNGRASQPCLDATCPVRFDLKPVPDGLSPSGTLRIDTDPYRVTIAVTGLGDDPARWLTAGSAAEDEGAERYALYASESDDNPVGGLLCVLDDQGTCSTSTLPRLTTYNRLTLLAVNDASTLPPIAQGLARIVATVSFSPLLTPEGVS